MAEREQPYNPLDRVELGKSVERALLAQRLKELGTFLAGSGRQAFPGAGLYALYYTGGLSWYEAIAGQQPSIPIYVGRARPPGARQGALGLASSTSKPVLFERLRQHVNSVRSAEEHAVGAGAPGLRVSDFVCRHLVVDDIWVPLGEALLIAHYRPVWNVVVDGFGNHGVGGGREKQARSSWDILHPGREWAAVLPVTRSVAEIHLAVEAHVRALSNPDLDAAPVVDDTVMRALADDGQSESE
jgi:hypothetical protein